MAASPPKIAAWLSLPIVFLLSGGCRLLFSTQTPSASTTAAPSPSKPALTADRTPSVSVSPTPTVTLSPTVTASPTPSLPKGLDLVIETPPGSIPPGEYLLVMDWERWEDEGTIPFRFVTWDGKQSGGFFHLMKTPEAGMSIGSLWAGDGRVWFGEEPNAGLISVDFRSMEMRQFLFPDGCFGMAYFGPQYFIYYCITAEGADWQNHVIDAQRFTEVGYFEVPYELRLSGWVGPDRLEYSEVWSQDATTYQFCSAAAPQWLAACRQFPFEVGATDPTGTWTWIAPPAEDSTAFSSAFPIAVVPRSCIDQDDQTCGAKVTFPSEWLGKHETFETYPSWSPDGRTLIVLDYAGSECAPVWVWAYDTLTATARGIAKVTGCAMDTTDQLAWSKDSEHFVVTRVSPTDSKYKNVVVALDGTTYPLPTTDFVAASFVVP